MILGGDGWFNTRNFNCWKNLPIVDLNGHIWKDDIYRVNESALRVGIYRMKWVGIHYLRVWISIFDHFNTKHSLQKRKKCSLIVELINKGEIEIFLLRQQDWSLVWKYVL